MICGLMSDEEWSCLESFVIERGGRSGRGPRVHPSFWMGFSGLREPALPDVICTNTPADGRRCTASSGIRRLQDCGVAARSILQQCRWQPQFADDR